MRALLSYFLITLSENDSQNISVIEIWNVRGEIAVPYSYAVTLKNEKPFLNFLFPVWNLHQILNIFK